MSLKGFVREIDCVGRVVIPKQLRKELGLYGDGSRVVISNDNGTIIMKKAVDSCAFCKAENNLSAFAEQYICSDCLEKLKRL